MRFFDFNTFNSKILNFPNLYVGLLSKIQLSRWLRCLCPNGNELKSKTYKMRRQLRGQNKAKLDKAKTGLVAKAGQGKLNWMIQKCIKNVGNSDMTFGTLISQPGQITGRAHRLQDNAESNRVVSRYWKIIEKRHGITKSFAMKPEKGSLKSRFASSQQYTWGSS